MSFLSLFQAFLLVIALSIDAFAASFAYGADKIKIPLPSLLVITGICSGTLGVSLFLGGLIAPYLPPHLTSMICFGILFLLGVVKLFDSTLKNFIKKYQYRKKQLRFTLFDVKFILQIYVDCKAADRDLSRRLSPSEAASLAIALSLDGLAVGLGAGMAQIGMVEVLLLSVLSTFGAVVAGGALGGKVASFFERDLSWVGGALLILLAFLKLR